MTDMPSSGWDLLQGVLGHRGWDIREGQRAMVEVIDECLSDEEGSQTISAPTGTGKSLANLCSAVAHGGRIVYATSTKALQNQLRSTELPRLAEDMRAVYGRDLTYAILKGKDNYPCIHELKRLYSAPGLVELDGEQRIVNEMYDKITSNIEAGKFGDLDCEDELKALSQETRDKLLSSKCSKVNSVWSEDASSESLTPEQILQLDWNKNSVCTYTYATAYAMLADVVVVNTALLVADVSLVMQRTSEERGTSAGKSFTAGRTTVIIDEAHHTSGIVAGSMSTEIDFLHYSKQLRDLADKVKKVNTDLYKQANTLSQDFREADKLLRSLAPIKDADGDDRNELNDLLIPLLEKMDGLSWSISKAKEIGGDAVSFATNWWLDFYEDDSYKNYKPAIKAMWETQDGGDFIYDVTVNVDEESKACTINTVPLDVSFFGKNLLSVLKLSQDRLENKTGGVRHIVACSATIQGNLHKTLGFPNCFHDEVDSPFDAKRARLWVPDKRTVPSPPKDWKDKQARASRDWLVKVAAADVVRAAQGRTLILATSNATVRNMVDYLAMGFPDYTLLHQFEGNRDDNMRKFAEDEHSIFVGTVGFWEGVDIPGKALSAVVIDKILFPHPSDPVSEAQRKFVARRGGNAFKEVSVEHASTMIAQGFGRLIRSVEDAGLVAILDPRVVDEWYGGLVLSKINRKTPMTRDKDVALRWLSQCVEGTMEVDTVEGWDKIGKKKTRPAKRSTGKIIYHR